MRLPGSLISFDGLGRVIQTQTRRKNGHTILSKTTVYNNCGQIDKQYVPQEKDFIPNRYTPPLQSWKSINYKYDRLGRVTTQTNADGTRINNNYSASWQTIVTNERGFRTSYAYDAFGRLIKVQNTYPVATGQATDITTDSATISGSFMDINTSSVVTVSVLSIGLTYCLWFYYR